MATLIRRPATFTEADAWVQLYPEQFTRLFPYIATIWQTEDGRVMVETDGSSKPDQAWWELKAQQASHGIKEGGVNEPPLKTDLQQLQRVESGNRRVGLLLMIGIATLSWLSACSLNPHPMVILVHPTTGQTVTCQADAPRFGWAWGIGGQVAVENCAKQYQNLGYVMSDDLTPEQRNAR